MSEVDARVQNVCEPETIDLRCEQITNKTSI